MPQTWFSNRGTPLSGTGGKQNGHDRVSRLLVPLDHLEGEPLGALPVAAMKFLLTFTKPLDDVLPDTAISPEWSL
jgi:hypothetical protein